MQPELDVSASHHIYRRPFLSSWGVFALAFSDTAQNVGRSTGADGHRETHRTERRYQQPTLAGLQKSFNKQGNEFICSYSVISFHVSLLFDRRWW